MSFVFRGSRGDIEAGFPDFISERRPLRIHSGRTVNSNSMAFLVTIFLVFMILNSHQLFPNFLFHVGCIDPWLRQQGSCPVCKHRIVTNGDNIDASFMV